MHQLLLLLASVGGALATSVVISDTVVSSGDGNFNFEVLGSLCFVEGTTATVSVNTASTTSGAVYATQKLLVFTETTLHNMFTTDTACADQDVRSSGDGYVLVLACLLCSWVLILVCSGFVGVLV
jgi:hypothetical protein